MTMLCKKYFYDGPIYWFDTIWQDRFVAETTAKSPKQALSFLSARVKRENGYSMNTKIHLDPSKIKDCEGKNGQSF